MAFSPDGKVLAYSASSDQRVQLRRATDGALLRSFVADTESGVDEVAFSADGSFLASTWNRTQTVGGFTTFFGGAEAWNAAGFALTTDSHANYVTSVAWLPDGSALATGSSDRTVRLWDASSGAELRRFDHGDFVGAVAVSPDGALLASGGSDSSIRLWDVATGQLVQTLTGHSDDVRTLDFSPDGSYLASGAGGFGQPDPVIRLWDVASGHLAGSLAGHLDWITAVRFTADGRGLASASRDGTLRLWRIADGATLLEYGLGGALPLSLDLSPTAALFAYGLNTGEVVLARP